MAVGSHPVLTLSMLPTEAMTRYQAVVLGTNEQEVDLAGADVVIFGVVQETVTAADVTDGRAVAVQVQGVTVMQADGVVAWKDPVYTDASGDASATGTTNVLGTALSAAAAAGDWIKVLLA